MLKPFLQRHIFASEEQAVRALLRDHVLHQIETLRARVSAQLPQQAGSAQAPSGAGEHQRVGHARERTAALKEIDKLEKSIAELIAYENEVVYPLATQQVAIDFDDGVKVNYAKFGRALRRIAGVS